MKKLTLVLIGVVLTVITILMISIAIKSRDANELDPKTQIENAIKEKSDSVAVVSVVQPDSSKLRKLQQLKIQVAKAILQRQLDSLDRIKNK